MRLAEHITLHFNNNISMAALFLDIKKAFDTTRHSGLLYKLSELEFSTSLIKLIAFLTDRKFKVLIESKFFMPREIIAGVPQGCVLAPALYNIYIYINK
jgi:retron-type reverse transcriptase